MRAARIATQSIFSCAILGATILLAACSGTWKVKGSCDSNKNCKVEGEVGGTFSSVSNYASAFSVGDTMDASDFELNVSGSTIPYPSTGTVTISLVDSGNGAVQAAKLFAWTRIGEVIRLSNPSAVNAWATNNRGSSDSIKYDITPFNSIYGQGEQTMTVSAKYQGVTKASSTTTVTGCSSPSGYPRKDDCISRL